MRKLLIVLGLIALCAIVGPAQGGGDESLDCARKALQSHVHETGGELTAEGQAFVDGQVPSTSLSVMAVHGEPPPATEDPPPTEDSADNC